MSPTGQVEDMQSERSLLEREPARRTKINGSYPPLTAVWTAYATEPLLRLLPHQSSWPALDHVAVSTWIGGSTSRRSAPSHRR
jgi:hypothetical protein